MLCYPPPSMEDGGGAGTGGAHWEMRVFRDEYMTGSASLGVRTLSALTLALFADSGWYDVDASQAEVLAWGRNAGCEFVSRRCAEWPREYLCRSGDESGCTLDRRSQGYCDVREYKWLPENEQ